MGNDNDGVKNKYAEGVVNIGLFFFIVCLLNQKFIRDVGIERRQCNNETLNDEPLRQNVQRGKKENVSSSHSLLHFVTTNESSVI